MKMSNRKQRGANFSNEEKMALLNIIGKHQNIIENKKTDNTTIQEKNRAWMKVEAEFNAISPDGCYRNWATLKKFYENKKKDARKAAADEKFQIRCTGGGPPKIVKKDPAHELILSLMNIKTVQGLSNPFDSDSNNEALTQTKVVTKPQSNEFEYELNTQTNNNLEYEIIIDNHDAEIIQNDDAERFDNYMLRDDESDYENTQALMVPVQEAEDNSLAMTNIENTVDALSCKPPQNKKSFNDKLEANVWKKYNPPKLQNNLSKELRNPLSTPRSTPKSKENATKNNRKRPATVVKALTSSSIAEKYDQLVEKRLEIAKMTIVEFHQKTNEHLKKMELLDLEIAIKKRQLNQLKRINYNCYVS